MRKTLLVHLLLLLLIHTGFSQSTVAKLTYEEAEEAYNAGNYQECLQQLSEAEKLFGKKNVPIAYLKILAYDKLVEAYSQTNTETGWLENYTFLRNECIDYMNAFGDLSNAEDKTREVMKIRNRYKNDYDDKKVKGYLAIIEKAQKGNAEAQYELGTIYESLNFSVIALIWYQKAADNKHTAAMVKTFDFGKYIKNIKGHENDKDDDVHAFKRRYIEMAVAAGSPEGMLKCGKALMYGYNGYTKDLKAALALFEKAAAKGNNEAVANIGEVYYLGGPDGASHDYAKAMAYYNKSIELGYVYGYNFLAYLYKEGKGVPVSLEKTVECYQKIIQKNPEEVWCYVQIGTLYAQGLDKEKDYAKALECYQKAVEKYPKLKDQVAQYLGQIYYKGGHGIKADPAKALAYLEQTKYLPQSMYVLGLMYQYGEGVAYSYSTAMQWFQKAVDKNHPGAMRSLGYMYEMGLGVRKNKKQADLLYQRAAEEEKSGKEIQARLF